jgi:RNA-binding protein
MIAPMQPLSSSQKRWLRGQAHGLKPLVRIGKNGLTEGVVVEIDAVLANHELIKVHNPGTRDEKQAAARRLEEALAAAVVGMIGNVLILYRRQPDPEKRTIELPAG